MDWTLGDGSRLRLIANLGSAGLAGCALPEGELIFESRPGLVGEIGQGRLPGWSLAWFLARAA